MSTVQKTRDTRGLRRFKPYPANKDSGVEWLGEIPAHWEVKRLKRVFRVVNGSTPQSAEPEYWDGDIPWVTPEDLGDLVGAEIRSTRRSITEAGYRSCGTTMVPTGSLVLSTRAPIGHLAIAGVDLCTNQGCRSLVFPGRQVRKYFYYQLFAARPELESLGQGSTFKELAKNLLEDMLLIKPLEDEQRAVAHFLDRETAKIDALVAKKERLIELLQEKRTALITRAVTKGLDPNVPMKDSGVDWLGEIPAHWEIKRLKRIASLRAGAAITAESIEEVGEYPVYGGNGIRGFTSSYTHEGEFPLIGRQGALCGCVNFASGRFWASEHAVVAAPQADIHPRWLSYLLSAMSLNSYSESAAQPGLAVDTISALQVPVSSLSEQRAIVAFLDEETTKIDALIAKVHEAIECLKEHRTALIAAAVTGKIDVREEVSV